MSEPVNTMRRREQAEHIVNSLKLKTSKFHLTGTKKLKKNKKKLPARKDSKVFEAINTPLAPQGPWFKDEDGRVKIVQFIVQKPVPPTAQESNTFSSMFKQLAMKFKSTPPVPDSIYSKVFQDAQSGGVYFANSKDSDQQLEIFKLPAQPANTQLYAPLVSRINFDDLKIQYNLGFLYS